jgi:hypothetical protein
MKHNLDLSNTKYSEETLEKYINSFSGWDWYYISYCQVLSEKFIEKHSDKLNWYEISFYQKLSEEFMKKHIDKIDIGCLTENKNISEKIKQEIQTLKEII